MALTVDDIYVTLQDELRRLLPRPISIGSNRWIDEGRRYKFNVLGSVGLKIIFGPDDSHMEADAEAMRISILDCTSGHNGKEVSYSFKTIAELVRCIEHYFQTNDCIIERHTFKPARCSGPHCRASGTCFDGMYDGN